VPKVAVGLAWHYEYFRLRAYLKKLLFPVVILSDLADSPVFTRIATAERLRQY
jgi:hypothetical protein